MTRRLAPNLVALLLVAMAGGCSAGDGSSPAEALGHGAAADTTFPNDRAAYAFFVGKGLTSAQAAGIVGNFDVESGDDPTAVESGGGGRGLAQWLAGGRWDTTSGDNAAAYAKQRGESLESLQLQLEFTWFELTTFPGYGLAKLEAATTASAAASAFTSGFEGCSTCDESARIADAEAVLAAYGGETLDGGAGGAGDDAGVACTVTGGDGAADAEGVCLATSDCAALPDHVSTPGFCPGAANIECCTPVAAAGDGGAFPGADASGGVGGGGGGGDASAPDGDSGASTATASDAPAGGCAVSAAPLGSRVDVSWLAALTALLLTVRRRRRVATAARPVAMVAWSRRARRPGRARPLATWLRPSRSAAPPAAASRAA